MSLFNFKKITYFLAVIMLASPSGVCATYSYGEVWDYSYNNATQVGMGYYNCSYSSELDDSSEKIISFASVDNFMALALSATAATLAKDWVFDPAIRKFCELVKS